MNARRQANLNQVVCTLEGMCFRLQMTPGDFAVVIHGDPDCANVLFTGADFPGTGRFFCTRLTEAQAVSGCSTERLETCLELVCREKKPQALFLLGTCLSALIGEQNQEVARRIAERTGCRIIALSGAGMRFVSQAEICDRFARLMLDAAEPAVLDERAVNLVGFHPGREVIQALDRMGLRVNSVLDLRAPLSAWRSLGRAHANLVCDAGLFAGFLEETGRRFGQVGLPVPYPVGYRATNGFFVAVRKGLSLDPSCTPLPADQTQKARSAVEQTRRQLSGKPMGYNIGSLKNLDPRRLALEGLTDLPVFEELGLKPVILVQGDDRPGRLAAVQKCLSEFGCRHPVEVFSDTVYFQKLCHRLGLGLVYAADHLGSGSGFLAIGSLQPGYSGVADNLEKILGAYHGSESIT